MTIKRGMDCHIGRRAAARVDCVIHCLTILQAKTSTDRDRKVAIRESARVRHACGARRTPGKGRGNLAGKRDHLAGRIQEAYGITREETEKQVQAWQARQKDLARPD